VTIWGGDAGTDVGFHPPAAHPGFAKTALAYDPATDAWFESEGSPAGPVTTVAVTWRDRLIIPTGEVRPGVRTPAVWSTDTRAAPSP
jgi:N-acetylneuraminic acid mutarotase